MQKECKKREPDWSVLKDSMKRTAAYRQNFCHKNPTQAVLETFPSLQIKRFVRMLSIQLVKHYVTNSASSCTNVVPMS